MDSLVSTAWLAQRLDDARLCVADVRWYLAGKRGADEYAAGHIPGAVFVDVDAELSDPRGASGARHPLPSAERFAGLLARLGANEATVLVAYDDAGGAIAARLWWLCRYFTPAPRALVLDGGIGAWLAEGRAISREPHARTPGPTPRLVAHPERVIDKGTLAARIEAGAVVLDARAPERYEGRSEPVDARPGHIPGARNAPFAANLRDGRFLPSEELRARYQALGALEAGEVVAYCGSGVTACHDLLALSLCGRDDARLYAGSWSEWAADPARQALLGSARYPMK